MMRWPLLALPVLILASLECVHAGVVGTAHDLSVTGPVSETANACVFCHTPHSAVMTRALWNRELPTATYQLYESSTLGVELQQPTGATRLCLSCHDGTLALGAMRMHPEPGLGLLTGPAVLGTDLSDDHPVSFVYDSQTAALQPDLADPAMLPDAVRLDSTEQMQCTTCHDPHEDRYPHFLVTDNAFSQLCVTCHRKDLWDGSAHATSAASWNGIPPDPWPDSDLITVAENGCENCHRTHAAPAPERLLAALPEEDVCYPCHSGHVARKNIRAEFQKPDAHPIERQSGTHDPTESPLIMPQHVECVDCHSPHQARAASVVAGMPGPLTGASGVNISGGTVFEATFEYEVCLKCHGLVGSAAPLVFRQDDITNVRLEIDPTNPSYHPVADIGRNTMIEGLLPGYTPSSIISCSDCHSSDTAALGATGVRGPHGSVYDPILMREYRISGDEILESFQNYSLCYNCHDRTVLLSEGPNQFSHREHVLDARASCAICHDAHGSRQHPRLINFMIEDQAGNTPVHPALTSGRLDFVFLGEDSGQCFLTCHGKDHDPEGYGPLGGS
jgi:predicted CXXCH cytochrome family protein